jgi:hypothetical protein
VVHALFRLLRGKSALGGDAWLKELRKALDDMDRQPATAAATLPTLMHPDQTLDLLVTATDFYGSARLLQIGDPASSWESRHDHVFRFMSARGANGIASDFNGSKNVSLAFAARASASFPVAFPPIRLDDLKHALGEDVDTQQLAKDLYKDRLTERRDEHAAEALASNLYLVDGGVLDNYPFGIAYRRVSRKMPVLETSRVFVYLEPDPRAPMDLDRPAAGTVASPRVFQMFWGATSSIPGAEPISQDLTDIHQHNQRVERIAEVLRDDERFAREEQRGQKAAGETRQSIAHRLEKLLALSPNGLAKPAEMSSRVSGYAGEEAPPPAPGVRERALQQIQKDRLAIEADAARSMPIMEDAYIRLRVQSVLDQLGRNMATRLCDSPEDYDGVRVALARAVVFEWAKRKGLIGESKEPAATARARREAFLLAYDLGYLRRRLRFVSDWLNTQYAPSRYGEWNYGLQPAQIIPARDAIAKNVERISGVLRGLTLADLGLGSELPRAVSVVCVEVDKNLTPAAQAEAILAVPANFAAVDTLSESLQGRLLEFQKSVTADLYGDFVDQTKTWPAEASRAVLARYLGFPYWDRVAYPYTAFSGVGDMTRIDIVRFSPADTLTFSEGGATKLVGSTLFHFGAFRDRDGREKDYLWGRLDGAERVLGLLLRPQQTNESLLLKVANRILDEEAAQRGVSRKNLDTLRQCVQKKGSC